MKESLPLRLKKQFLEHQALILVLLLGTFHGLIYIFLMPPWQHYDEPGHFEYAWLLARGNGLFETGPEDQGLRREIAASMLEHGFFQGLDVRPNLISQTEPVWIGIAQTNDQPLYHFIVSLPLRLIWPADVTTQLYLARCVSLVFYLLTLIAAYGTIVEITPAGHTLRWLVPLTLALLPGFTDLMTAVNNDVGATAFFSLLIWVGVRMMRRGFSWGKLTALIGLTVFCFWTKNTVSVAPVTSGLFVLFALFRDKNRRYAWCLIGAVALLGLAAILRRGDAAHWLRQVPQAVSTRAQVSQAPLGDHAFQIRLEPGDSPPRIVQVLPFSEVLANRGRSFTLGVWMWTDVPGNYRTPIIDDGRSKFSKNVNLTKQPHYFVAHGNISTEATQLNVILTPRSQGTQTPETVYYDGIVLVAGNFPADSEPHFNTHLAIQGIWNGKDISNLIRNGSAEESWPWIQKRFDDFIGGIFPARPSLTIGALLDGGAAYTYFRLALEHMTKTFWGMFGWGHVPLRGFHPYTLLGIITLVGIAGAIFTISRRIHQIPWEVALLIGFSAAVIWGVALMRGVPTLVEGNLFVPSARYAYPAILPTILLLVIGWWRLLRKIGHRLNISRGVLLGMYYSLFLILDILSIYSIWTYYYG